MSFLHFIHIHIIKKPKKVGTTLVSSHHTGVRCCGGSSLARHHWLPSSRDLIHTYNTKTKGFIQTHTVVFLPILTIELFCSSIVKPYAWLLDLCIVPLPNNYPISTHNPCTDIKSQLPSQVGLLVPCLVQSLGVVELLP